MNPRLDRLQMYPFERVAELKQGVTGNPAHPHINLGIGEPRHMPPQFVIEALTDAALLKDTLRAYPATRGAPELRGAIADWLQRRFSVTVDPARQILPVSGTREALFSFGQAVLSGKPDSVGILPNPFYQIYEGAVLLGGAEPYYVDTTPATGFLPDYDSIPESVWARCELLYLCSPGNPTGRCLDSATLVRLLELADAYDFIIAADECYSEIYPDEGNPPAGLLEVAAAHGRPDFNRCVVFHSLSKRSNLPGLRSGFVAGDAQVLSRYYQYRTYEGCALGEHVQQVSMLAWSDETHVLENRARYREKFETVEPLLREAFDFRRPEGGFYHWLNVAGDDQTFARELFRDQHITVLPGSFLGRDNAGINPGSGYVRVAWVAEAGYCLEAAERLCHWALARQD